jgi:hypothetical protein
VRQHFLENAPVAEGTQARDGSGGNENAEHKESKVEYKENNHDNNGKVLIPAETEREDLPTAKQVEQFAARQNGGEWHATGGWHATGDSDEVYMEVKRVK